MLNMTPSLLGGFQRVPVSAKSWETPEKMYFTHRPNIFIVQQLRDQISEQLFQVSCFSLPPNNQPFQVSCFSPTKWPTFPGLMF